MLTWSATTHETHKRQQQSDKDRWRQSAKDVRRQREQDVRKRQENAKRLKIDVRRRQECQEAERQKRQEEEKRLQAERQRQPRREADIDTDPIDKPSSNNLMRKVIISVFVFIGIAICYPSIKNCGGVGNNGSSSC